MLLVERQNRTDSKSQYKRQISWMCVCANDVCAWLVHARSTRGTVYPIKLTHECDEPIALCVVVQRAGVIDGKWRRAAVAGPAHARLTT